MTCLTRSNLPSPVIPYHYTYLPYTVPSITAFCPTLWCTLVYPDLVYPVPPCSALPFGVPWCTLTLCTLSHHVLPYLWCTLVYPDLVYPIPPCSALLCPILSIEGDSGSHQTSEGRITRSNPRQPLLAGTGEEPGEDIKAGSVYNRSTGCLCRLAPTKQQYPRHNHREPGHRLNNIKFLRRGHMGESFMKAFKK